MASLRGDLAAAQERISELEAVLQSSSPGNQSDKEAQKVNLIPMLTLYFARREGLCLKTAGDLSKFHHFLAEMLTAGLDATDNNPLIRDPCLIAGHCSAG